MVLMHPCWSLEVHQIPKSYNALIDVFKFFRYVWINKNMTFTSSLRFLYIFIHLAYCAPWEIRLTKDYLNNWSPLPVQKRHMRFIFDVIWTGFPRGWGNCSVMHAALISRIFLHAITQIFGHFTFDHFGTIVFWWAPLLFGARSYRIWTQCLFPWFLSWAWLLKNKDNNLVWYFSTVEQNCGR